jgi:GT2 family glycosyltransferase
MTAMSDLKNNTAAIVVTHNRKDLLMECIRSLLNQTEPCRVIIVDNASDDGTLDIFRDMEIFGEKKGNIIYLRLEENTGGAGGFSSGLKYGMSGDWDWFWLMDDDAKPEPDALENLLQHAEDRKTVYGSIAVNHEKGGRRLSWPAETGTWNKNRFVYDYDSLSELNDVDSMPFLGFFINRVLVDGIGLPDPDYFIYCDDMDYCERAKKKGAHIVLVKDSIIYHPGPKNELIFRIGKHEMIYRDIPPWKTYYHSRNKILLARKYFRKKLFLQTIPGIFFRMIICIFMAKSRLNLLKAYISGVVDGLSGKTGKNYAYHSMLHAGLPGNRQ